MLPFVCTAVPDVPTGVGVAVGAGEWTRGLAMWLRWRSRAWERQSLVSPAEAPVVMAH
ncbi:hypothetical protein [Corallococcus interemptor]|uniref:hypothetical protein n=1 Tax=Corallococcus interemptor TaxID=2316720 RepID=UPI00142F0D75|nr:hypothetical protein [Corallococcus interemptor]